MSSKPWKRLVRPLGIGLALAAGIYFLLHAKRSLSGHDLGMLAQPRVLVALAVLILAYMTLVPLTAVAWAWLLRSLGQPVRFALSAPILATTQFAKYVPGNVAHHLGRVVVARARGLELRPTLLSMGYETILMIVACAHVSSLTLLWAPPPGLSDWGITQHHGWLIVAISGVAVALILAAPYLVQFLMRLRRVPDDADAPMRPGSLRPAWSTCFAGYLLYAVNFLILGGGLWVVAKALSPGTVTAGDFILLSGAFAGSWILGFFAPGAPAGLGVREAVLSIWLGTTFDATVAVSLIIMLRIATTLGDALTLGWGSLVLAANPNRTQG